MPNQVITTTGSANSPVQTDSEDSIFFQYWHKLPAELKITVLEQHLTFPTPITYTKHWALMKLRLLPLLRTDFATIAKAAYYNNNVFQVTDYTLHYGHQPSLRVGSEIRHLEFRFQSVSRNDYGGLGLLWQPANQIPRSWQQNIPKLKTLRIVLDARGYWRTIFDGSRIWVDARVTGEMLVEWERILTENVLSLTPEDITFEIEADGCPVARPEDVHHDESSCTCKEDLETDIKGLMVKK